MAHIIVPDRLIQEPVVIEMIGGPEVYADGAIVKDFGEVVRIVLYVETRVNRPAEQNFLVVMRRTGFDRSLLAAAARFLPKS